MFGGTTNSEGNGAGAFIFAIRGVDVAISSEGKTWNVSFKWLG